MCGIAGVLEKEGLPVEEGRVRRMTALLAHRGPDDEGLYCRGAIGLGHRLLLPSMRECAGLRRVVEGDFSGNHRSCRGFRRKASVRTVSEKARTQRCAADGCFPKPLI